MSGVGRGQMLDGAFARYKRGEGSVVHSQKKVPGEPIFMK
jgi:hypothetical protein